MILLCAVVIVAGSAARLVGLDHLPMWHDEVFTLVRVFGYDQDAMVRALFTGDLLTPAALLAWQQPDPTLGWADTWRALTGHPEHAPLYYLLARLATDLPLDPVVAARGTSALFGLLLPLAALWLMRELFGRGLAPWLAAALIAVSPLHLLYAQEARQYALWTLLVLAASAALVRALRPRPAGAPAHWPAWSLYGALLAVGLYAHLLFVLVLPVHAAFAWLVYAQRSGRLLRPAGLPVRPWLVATSVAVVLFLPWIIVVLTHLEQAAHYTAWMDRVITREQLWLAWGWHLSRVFVDLNRNPLAPPWLWLALVPLGLSLLYYLWRAPRPAAWLLPLLLLAYGGVVLGPDLLLGGSRSQHARYALPALLAIQLMAAWALADLVNRPGRPRLLGLAVSLLLMLGGGLSIWQVQQAETWWSKQFSADNIAIARLANAGDRPLVAASASGVGPGELISLAYHLDDRVRAWGEPLDAPPVLPPGFGDVILLTPTEALRAAASPGRALAPVPGSWQWWQARPVAPAGGAP